MDMPLLYRAFLDAGHVCTDTRKIVPGSIFFALKGGNFNGNNFVQQALEQGCALAVADEAPARKDDRIILVDDVLTALQKLSTYHRRQFSIPVIGLTGSNGKTTTKELIAEVLAKKFKVHATLGNLNNHIGVPLTLLSMPADAEIAIIEMGANQPNDIRELCDIAEPTAGLITNIGRAHLEGFGGIEGVVRAKSQLYDHLRKTENITFLHVSDERLRNLSSGLNTYTYSTDDTPAAVRGKLEAGKLFVSFRWQTDEYSSPVVQTNMTGGYNLPNFIAAATIGTFYGVKPESISKALSEYKPTNNRSQIQNTESNTLILDAYNANPTSMMSAIKDFESLESEREKQVILGDMLELGEESHNAHLEVINQITAQGLRGILVGPAFNALLKSTPEAGLMGFDQVDDAAEYLKQNPLSDSLILIKGSRGIRLEKLTEVL